MRHYTHEEYVQRKELEYALSINETWRFERMFTYSSFHMGWFAKYHRIIFNLFATAMVLVSNYGTRSSNLIHFMIAHAILILVFTIYVIALRPYRCWSSNTVYIIAMLGLSLQVGALTGTTVRNHREDTTKLSDQTRFLLITLLGVVIGLTVLLAFAAIVVISAIIKVRWPIDYSII